MRIQVERLRILVSRAWRIRRLNFFFRFRRLAPCKSFLRSGSCSSTSIPNSKLAKVILVLGIPFWVTVLWFVMGEISYPFKVRTGRFERHDSKTRVETQTGYTRNSSLDLEKSSMPTRSTADEFRERQVGVPLGSWPFNPGQCQRGGGMAAGKARSGALRSASPGRFLPGTRRNRLDKLHVFLAGELRARHRHKNSDVAFGRFWAARQRQIQSSRATRTGQERKKGTVAYVESCDRRPHSFGMHRSRPKV